MAQEWEVVGGADKGGILIREGVDLKSPQCEARLATGSIVEEMEVVGERLHYKLVRGSGPAEGWASIRISGKELLVKSSGGGGAGAVASAAGKPPEHDGGPGAAGPVSVDESLKKSIEAQSEKVKGKIAEYVMKYGFLKYPLASCKMRILCFHNAGSTESTYTGPGTPFMKWVKETGQIEVLAIDYPGRDKVKGEKLHVSTSTLSPLMLAVLYEKVSDGVPYCVWGHSVGTWVAFEFMILARKIGLPMPKAAFLNAFPAPHLPVSERPWPQSVQLDSNGIKKELEKWDSGHFGTGGGGRVIFDGEDWSKTWEPMMRADFRLYDEYEFTHSGAPPFDFPLHVLHMEKEFYNKAEWLQMWKDWTTKEFNFEVMKNMGHLTCWYKPDFKMEYMTKATDVFKKVFSSL
mmetsp:Transcript_2970/g.6529  ORF Transcript_2970/g.6529 Transcript_2970/m.6529 type:complete len:404 (-) Transcript_2970:156-1367(-)